MEANKPTIVIVTENKTLEHRAHLLVRSIRTFGGWMKDAPILSYQPRRGGTVSDETRAFFKKNGVQHIEDELNHRYPFSRFANKIYAAAHAEKYADSSSLVFLDSDVIVLSEPSEFAVREGYDIALRPVDLKLIGSEGPGDINENYWKKMYDLLGVKDEKFVTTSVDRKRIRGYWQGGHIIVDRNLGFFEQWRENFERVMEAQLVPWDGMNFIEQSTLGGTVCQMGLRVRELPKDYDYPLHLHQRMGNSNKKVDNIDEVTTLHYHSIFDDALIRMPVKGFFTGSDRSRWVKRELKRSGLFRPTFAKAVYYLARGLEQKVKRVTLDREKMKAGE